jgi:glycosyltransferase involved in cell wall biosynthesis
MGRGTMRLALLGRDANRLLAFRGSLIAAAQAAGHEVFAITGPGDASTQAALRAADVAWHGVPLDGGSMHPLRDLAYRREVERLLRRIQPDAVLAYNPKPLAHGTVAARRAGVGRVVAMVTGLGHGFVGSRWRERLVRAAKVRLYRRAFDACDALLLQNPSDVADLDQAGAFGPDTRSKVRMIAGSGVDVERFRPVPLPAGPHFLMISRPLREKGLPEYLHAARQVRRLLPQADFAWLGPRHDANPSAIPERELLAMLAQSGVRHLSECVDVRPAIGSCSVFVLPSHREGTSKVMLEAMAMGRPVITTDAPGCREVITDQAQGRTVPVQAVDALVDAMLQLGQAAPLRDRMGAAARQRVLERHDARQVNAVVLEALAGLSGGPATA